MTNNGTEAPKVEKKSEGRSPSWPAIPLKEALERAEDIYKVEKRHPTTRDVLFQHWGYSTKSSYARQVAAALKSYGLIESVGDKWRITDNAWRVFVHPDPVSPERSDLIKKFALTPKIHQEIWSKYGKDLPSENTLKHFLIFDKGFNQSAVDDFIKEFRETINFAGLLDEDLDESPESNPSNDNKERDKYSDTSREDDRVVDLENDSAIFKMTLPKGNMLEIKMKKKLSNEDYDSLFNERFFQIIKFSLAESSEDF